MGPPPASGCEVGGGAFPCRSVRVGCVVGGRWWGDPGRERQGEKQREIEHRERERREETKRERERERKTSWKLMEIDA